MVEGRQKVQSICSRENIVEGKGGGGKKKD
jgi:hypothetical protein